MKFLFFGLIVIVISCSMRADELDVSKTFERDLNHDGKADIKVQTISREGLKIMQVVSSWKGSHWRVFRTFFVNDRVAMTETDEDGNGTFESFVLYSRDGDLQAFKRQDSTVFPLSTAEADVLKKQNAVFSNFFEKIYTNADGTEVNKSIHNTMKDLQKLEKTPH